LIKDLHARRTQAQVRFVKDHEIRRWHRHARVHDSASIERVGHDDLHRRCGPNESGQSGCNDSMRDLEEFEALVHLERQARAGHDHHDAKPIRDSGRGNRTYHVSLAKGRVGLREDARLTGSKRIVNLSDQRALIWPQAIGARGQIG
jgi:hypothetical protein